MSHNQTLEINLNHTMIVKLNQLRKIDQNRATKVGKQLLDNLLIASAIPHDMAETSKRNLDIIDDFLQIKADRIPADNQ